MVEPPARGAQARPHSRGEKGAQAGERAAGEVEVRDAAGLLDDVMEAGAKRPGVNIVWFHAESGSAIQVVGHFPASSAFTHRTRDEAARKACRVRVRPEAGRYDKAHLIPFGYHGMDGSDRILVGWDPSQNQRQMRRFEAKMHRANRTRPIYWWTDVRAAGRARCAGPTGSTTRRALKAPRSWGTSSWRAPPRWAGCQGMLKGRQLDE